ncbi:MAG: hypothetical protein V4659_04025 [Pseudomonadota bacterium]
MNALSNFPMSRDWARRIVTSPDTHICTPLSVREEAWATLKADMMTRRIAATVANDASPTGGAA